VGEQLRFVLTPLYLLASFERLAFGGEAISAILAATSGAPTGIEVDIVVDIVAGVVS
jgi:hypothetical protein